MDEGFGNEFLRTRYVLLQEECEDRSLFSLYTVTNKAGGKPPILLSGRRRGKRKVFWTANPFLAGLQIVYRSCMQLTRRTRNHCYCPALLAQSSFCIVRRCWKQQRFIETFTANGKRQFQVVKFSKKRKNKTSIKGKAFRDFFLYIHLLRFVHLIQKADGLLLAFLGFLGLIKSLSF